MPTLDDVYRKFGEHPRPPSFWETQMGTLLLAHKCIGAGLLENPDPSSATAIYDQINKQTLGQLIRVRRKTHKWFILQGVSRILSGEDRPDVVILAGDFPKGSARFGNIFATLTSTIFPRC